MQTVLEQGSIDKPLTFDVGLIQLNFIPVCSLNPLTTIVQISILPLCDRNRAYMHGFQRTRSNVFLININFNYIIR